MCNFSKDFPGEKKTQESISHIDPLKIRKLPVIASVTFMNNNPTKEF